MNKTTVALAELETVEIDFYDHEVYAAGKLIASIGHDDDLTQPWLVLINGVEVFRHHTFNLMPQLHYVALQREHIARTPGCCPTSQLCT
jgi:hypothetical protein